MNETLHILYLRGNRSLQSVVFLNEEGERQLEFMRWGFKLPDRLVFNARSEGIGSSKFWQESFLERRCIVPADAVFESGPPDTGKKKPKYEITIPDQEPFGMAGVWKLWKNPKADQWERTFAVLTGEPNEIVAPIHDRMTTFLEPRDYAEYLTPTERPPLHLLRILPAQKTRAKLVPPVQQITQQASLF